MRFEIKTQINKEAVNRRMDKEESLVKKIEREARKSPGRDQQLDLFIKVLRLLCPNLTDASPTSDLRSI